VAAFHRSHIFADSKSSFGEVIGGMEEILPRSSTISSRVSVYEELEALESNT